MKPNFVMPNGHFSQSPGIHQYAICAPTSESERRQVNEFQDKLYWANGCVISEHRELMKSGARYILYTYQI